MQVLGMDPLPGPPKYVRHDRSMRKRRHSDAETDSMYNNSQWFCFYFLIFKHYLIILQNIADKDVRQF